MVKKWLGSNVGVGNVGNILDELQSLSPPCFSDSVFEFAFVTGLDRNRTTSDFRNRNRDWNFSVWAEQVKSIRPLQPKALNLTVWNPYYGCGWIVWYKDNSPATFFKKIAGVFFGGGSVPPGNSPILPGTGFPNWVFCVCLQRRGGLLARTSIMLEPTQILSMMTMLILSVMLIICVAKDDDYDGRWFTRLFTGEG